MACRAIIWYHEVARDGLQYLLVRKEDTKFSIPAELQFEQSENFQSTKSNFEFVFLGIGNGSWKSKGRDLYLVPTLHILRQGSHKGATVTANRDLQFTHSRRSMLNTSQKELIVEFEIHKYEEVYENGRQYMMQMIKFIIAQLQRSDRKKIAREGTCGVGCSQNEHQVTEEATSGDELSMS